MGYHYCCSGALTWTVYPGPVLNVGDQHSQSGFHCIPQELVCLPLPGRGKENSVSLAQKQGQHCLLSPSSARGKLSLLIADPSKLWGISTALLVFLVSAFWGTVARARGPLHAVTYSAWPNCTSFCSSSSMWVRRALHWVTKCRISSLPSLPNMLAAALERPKDYRRQQKK